MMGQTQLRQRAVIPLLLVFVLCLSGCVGCMACVASPLHVYKSKEYNLDDGRYRVTFSNAGLEMVVTAEGNQPAYVEDQTVKETTVERLEPSPMTQQDADRAYEVATMFCRSLHRKPQPSDDRKKGFFWTKSGTWVFLETCS